MDNITLTALEFPKILARLERFTSTALGRRLAGTLTPSTDITFIEDSYKELRELEALLIGDLRLELTGLVDIQGFMARLRPLGSFLPREDLLALRETLKVFKALQGLLSSDDLSLKFPITAKKIESISDSTNLFDELSRVFDNAGFIKDDASYELMDIRRSLNDGRSACRGLVENIARTKLDSLSSGDRQADDDGDEGLFTIRDDRFVLSVKVGRHQDFPGVLHGRSRTGNTYFIEPIKAVELNNRIAMLKREEAAEEIEILKALSRSFVECGDLLVLDTDVVAKLDLLQAKVLFGKELSASTALSINIEGAVNLKSARHPLLLFKEADGAGKKDAFPVTPIDILIEEGTRVLVLSGANAGGKTVALKTLGLLTLMVQSALPVPVGNNSEFILFKEIFADIGDRQNIAEDLSTFSAHLKRMGDILGVVSKESSALVLIDEIGVGTDPAEGSVLALTLIERLKTLGAVVAVTTHLNLLKAHAQAEDGFENASVIFDKETLQPLYRLSYGLPGASLALSVAENYGIPKELVDKARDRLDLGEGVFLESMRRVEEERVRIVLIREDLERVQKARTKALERLRDDRSELVKRAREKLAEITGKAEAKLMDIIAEAKAKGTKIPAKAKELREVSAKTLRSFGEERLAYSPRVGDTVEVVRDLSGAPTGLQGVLASKGKDGIVISVNNSKKTAEVQLGRIKLKVSWASLVKKVVKEKKVTKSYVSAVTHDIADASNSVKVIGMRVEEALAEVESAIDSAHMHGLATIDIIHGTGTGALKSAVGEYLAESPIVKSYHGANLDGGGAGVTVAVLK